MFSPDVVKQSFLSDKLEERGMPYTVDSVYYDIKDADYILLGMPDTVLEPPTSFAAVLKLLQDCDANLALGLYKTDNRNLGGYIEFDSDSKIVKRHIDKESHDFPASANNSWAVVAWNRRFTSFLHDELEKGVELRRLASRRGWTEILFGDVIDLAVQRPDIRVVADYVNRRRGFYWDISEPEKYFGLLRSYSPLDGHFTLDQRLDLEDSRIGPNRRIFIGHGHDPSWKALYSFFEESLQLPCDEFNRVETAGKTTQNRIDEMLDNATIAFLVLTGDDMTADGERLPRGNVLHELGLFQARLGAERAIVLRADDCERNSNLDGITDIVFPRGKILTALPDIVRVLVREGIIRASHLA